MKKLLLPAALLVLALSIEAASQNEQPTLKPADNPALQSHPASNGCAPTPAQIQLTVNGQKLQLLRELETIITTRPAPPINFKSWLSNTANRYRAWLDRLN